MTEIVLAAFIINLGIALGAGLYEAKIVLPLWFKKSANGSYQADAEAMRNTDTGRKFWGFVTTLPLTLLMIVNLVFACKAAAPLYGWWLSAALIVLLERTGTFTWFIPTAIKLQKGKDLPVSKTSNMVYWWIWVNYVRNALTFAALLIALKALMVL